jgi:hydroxymethylglutaryl-CoA synthase
MTFTDAWGVGMESVHDFFKPRRTFAKSDIVHTVLQEAGITNGLSQKVTESLSRKGDNVFTWPDTTVSVFREMPVFDGQFSNQCYVSRAQEALDHFREQTQADGSTLETWRKVICHLPYAAHGRRIGIELLIHELTQTGDLAALLDEADVQPPAADASPKEQAAYLKAMSQTPTYRRFVTDKLADAQRACAQVGNMYTGSVWLALLSALECELTHADDISGQRYGFVAYGSGSKSKVFEGTLQPQWRDVVQNLGIMARLDGRRAISFDTYIALHRGDITAPIVPDKAFRLDSIGATGDLEGTRRYAVMTETAAV